VPGEQRPGKTPAVRRIMGTAFPGSSDCVALGVWAQQLREKLVRIARHWPRRRRRDCRPPRRLRPRLALVAASALFVAVLVPTSLAWAQMGGPAAIIDAYESARNRGDMDTVVKLFADDAAVVDSDGKAHRGRQQIRLLLRPGVHPDWAAEVTDRTIIGDDIFWTERVGVHGTARSLSVMAIVRGGSIEVLAYGGGEWLLPSTSSTTGTPVLPAPYGLAGVLLAILSSIGVVTVPTSVRGQTALRGTLLVHLRRWSEGRSQWRREHEHAPARAARAAPSRTSTEISPILVAVQGQSSSCGTRTHTC
jgi:hypothetical protein